MLYLLCQTKCKNIYLIAHLVKAVNANERKGTVSKGLYNVARMAVKEAVSEHHDF